jgi:hypothetical protein
MPEPNLPTQGASGRTDVTPVRRIGPLIPFACSYEDDGRRYGVTLYATSWMLAEAAIAWMKGGRVDGELIGEVDA